MRDIGDWDLKMYFQRRRSVRPHDGRENKSRFAYSKVVFFFKMNSDGGVEKVSESEMSIEKNGVK